MVFASLIIVKFAIFSHCDSLFFSADLSFCKLISKIPLYIQNKFPVVSPVRGTLCFFTSLQGRSCFFWRWGGVSSTFQRALFHISSSSKTSSLYLLSEASITSEINGSYSTGFTKGCQDHLIPIAFRSHSYILPL